MNAQKNEREKSSNERVSKLLSELTLEEKASLCSGRDDWSTQSIERLNIPWVWVSDGLQGLRRAPAINKAGYGDQIPASCFPSASALAATWDTDLYRTAVSIWFASQALKPKLPVDRHIQSHSKISIYDILNGLGIVLI